MDANTLHLEQLRSKSLDFVSDTSVILSQGMTWLSKLDAMGMMDSAIAVLKNLSVGIFISIYALFSKERLAAGCRRVLHALFDERAEHHDRHSGS